MSEPELGNSALFLPTGYLENPSRSRDDESLFWDGLPQAGTFLWQEPVYALAREVAERRGAQVILDIGCGTGFKTEKYFGQPPFKTFGVDQDSGVSHTEETSSATWIAADLEANFSARLAHIDPELILCADVIEHVRNPMNLLSNIFTLIGRDGAAIVSTPDRARLERSHPLGPPTNPRHIREWSYVEFKQLLVCSGLLIVDEWHLLPRRYEHTPREALRILYRLACCRPVPDPRSCMAFLLRRADANDGSSA